MAWYLNFAAILLVGYSLSAEVQSAQVPAANSLAQTRIGRIIDGLGRQNTIEQEEGEIPQTTTPGNIESGGRWQPVPWSTDPSREQPSYSPRPGYIPWPGYFPRRQYQPRRYYTPEPKYIPGTTTSPVEPNVLPTQPEMTGDVDVSVVPVKPKANNFLETLDIKRITPEQVIAFQKQIAKKNQLLGEDLKGLLPGNNQLIDQLVASADKGQLTVGALKKLVSATGKSLSLQVQLKASGFIKQLVFNNLAMGALLNVNINLLNVNIANINIVGINVGIWGGGGWGGFWGFPHWPWKYPIWVGPGVWWGPCGCVWPYYNPHLNGADVLGIPYSYAAPVAGYQGELVKSGILLTNVGGDNVNYTIDGNPFTMKADYRQAVPRERIVISFDRGGSFGKAKYGINEGWYEFTPTKRGWELYETTAKITLDNSGNPFDFNYVLNNQQKTLKPGSKAKHSSKYPFLLKFKNGKGKTIQNILEEGEFQIAVGPNGGLALFESKDVTIPAPIPQIAQKADKKTPNIFAQPEKIPSLFGNTVEKPAPAGPATSSGPAAPSLFGP